MDKYRTLLNGQWTELDAVQLKPGYHVPAGVDRDYARGARVRAPSRLICVLIDPP